jgi:pimeloyl-ACP methyl ester carboxylesterase
MIIEAFVIYRTRWIHCLSEFSALRRFFLMAAPHRYDPLTPMGWFVLLIVFLVVGVLLVIVTASMIALSLLHPPRMSDGKAMYVLRRMSPADLGLTYERVSFTVRDEAKPGSDATLTLAGWWITNPSANGRCVVLLHGYADAKVGAIAWAPMWHSLGFNILAIDLRAHGESEGAHTTGGYFEQHDVEQVLDQLRTAQPSDVRQIVLFGVSLGSAVALALGARRRDLVDAIVLECPFTSFESATTSHARYLGAPIQPIMPLALRFARAISGATFDAVHPLDLMRTIERPMLIIQSAKDSFVDTSENNEIASVVAQRSNVTVWRARDAEHLLAIAVNPEEYKSQLSTFLTRALAPAPPGVPGGETRGAHV